jgi:tripartite-type tricarboxylate transporter receptor subunit TctC
VVVTNMPGAASNVAAAHIYNIAPKDGTFMGALFMGAVVDPLFREQTRPTHDATKFNYIGNANKDTHTCLVRADAGIGSFQDLFDKEIIMGATAEGSPTRDFATMLRNVLGVKFKIVGGYPGSREVGLALERGEVQGSCGQTWSSISTIRPEWFKEGGEMKVLVQEDNIGHPDLNKLGVPLAPSFAKAPEQKDVLELFYSQTVFGRPYVVAPEVPKERVEALRNAFTQAMHDPDLVAEAQRLNVDILPTSGREMQDKIAQMYAAPADRVEKARRALAAK